ncbi:MAG: type II toxin-antitoxin system VapC family toxin [Geminicoccaceae bacterium]
MVVDSSVAIAILRREEGWERLRDALLSAGRCAMSSATLVEAGMVMEGRLGRAGGRDLDRLVAEVPIEIVPFDFAQTTLAREAFRRFGKGRHPAGLNFGDCLSYALAKHLAAPLLFTGGDFVRTDVEPVVE